MLQKIDQKYFHSTIEEFNKFNLILGQQKKHNYSDIKRIGIIKLCKHKIRSKANLAAQSISLLVTFIFETLSRHRLKKARRSLREQQINNDLTLLNKEKAKELTSHFSEIVESEGLFKNKTKKQQEKYIRQAVSTYASSKSYYGPLVNEWILSLLETAKSEPSKKRIVFLARDGIAPYKTAEILKRKHPSLFEGIDLSLLYLSRKVIAWSKENTDNRQTLIDYAKQAGIKNDEHCLFVDIGFFGSMIDTIKETLSDITPRENIDFQFFVSHSSKAHGFMADIHTKLESVKVAGQNPAVHWLEDTHQGVGNSATKLERDPSGAIRPYTKNHQGFETCKETQEKSYLTKKAGMKAVIDAAEEFIIEPSRFKKIADHPTAWTIADDKARTVFDHFLQKYVREERKSFSKHF